MLQTVVMYVAVFGVGVVAALSLAILLAKHAQKKLDAQKLVQQQAEEAQRRAADAKKALDKVESCSKCGQKGVHWSALGWLPHEFPREWCRGCHLHAGEALHRPCPRCGHIVVEKVLDAVPS